MNGVGSITRPVREMKGFQRIRLSPGESKMVSFTRTADDLAFYDRNMQLTTEPGDLQAWIGGNSQAQLQTRFTLISP